MSMPKLLVAVVLLVLAASVFAGPAVQSPTGTALAPVLLPQTSAGAQQISLQLGGPAGQSTLGTHLAKISVLSFRSSVLSARDAATGQAGGGRAHQSLTVTKTIDAASPKLHQACCSGSAFKSATFTFYHQGTSPETFTYVLSDVVISSIRPIHNGGPDGQDLEEVTFTFGKITFTHTPAKTSASDDWKK